MLMAAGRSALGGLCVFLWCCWRRIPLFSRDGTLKAGIVAGLLFGTEFVLIFLAMELTSAGRVTLMMNVMPFWVAIGSHFLLGERMSVRAFIGMCVAFLGVFLVFSDHISRPGPYALYGDLIALVSGVLWGLTTLVIKRSKLANTAPEKTLLYQLVVAALVPLPFVSLSGPLLRNPDALSVAAFLFRPCSWWLYLPVVVLDDAPISRIQTVEFCLSHPGIRRAIERCHSERAFELENIRGSRIDRLRAHDYQ